MEFCGNGKWIEPIGIDAELAGVAFEETYSAIGLTQLVDPDGEKATDLQSNAKDLERAFKDLASERGSRFGARKNA